MDKRINETFAYVILTKKLYAVRSQSMEKVVRCKSLLKKISEHLKNIWKSKILWTTYFSMNMRHLLQTYLHFFIQKNAIRVIRPPFAKQEYKVSLFLLQATHSLISSFMSLQSSLYELKYFSYHWKLAIVTV